MTKVFKVLLVVVCLLAVIAALAITFTIGWRPIIGPRARALTDRKFETTPQRMERGRYLVKSTILCLDCHSDHDWKAEGMPPLPGRDGAGWIVEEEGLPGRVVAQNLTPDRETGAGNWTDDQLARAIREGIGHDGRALFPMMPYLNFQRLPDEDLASVIVYIRSLPAVRNPLPPTEVIFPVNYLIRSVPEPLTGPVPPPDLSTPEKRGQYLVALASCADCHTPRDRGRPLEGKAFAGGNRFKGPWGDVLAANITPDKTGIGYYNEQLFFDAMRTGTVMGRKLNPIMPWGHYRNMTDEDLKAIWAYLRTLKPVENRVRHAESQ